MRWDKEFLKLYAVTDQTWAGKEGLCQQVEKALKGGATCIQLREKAMEEQAFLREALALKVLCERYHAPLIINDEVNVGIACEADGVHVGQEDMTVKEARKRLGDSKILGVSVQNVVQAVDAQRDGADYLGVGAVFATNTKSDAVLVSLKTLKEICQAVTIPVVGIGGINKKNIHKLSDTGIAGCALVSAIFASRDIQKECSELLAQIERVIPL